jgi:hypothetical protein
MSPRGKVAGSPGRAMRTMKIAIKKPSMMWRFSGAKVRQTSLGARGDFVTTTDLALLRT